MPDRKLPDEPQWGPARTYRARPGGSNRGTSAKNVPVESPDDDDLVDADGRPLGGHDEDDFSRYSNGYFDQDGYHDPGHSEAEYEHPGYSEAGYTHAGYAEPTYAGHEYPDSAGDGRGGGTYGRARPSRGAAPQRAGGGRRWHPVRWVVLLLILAFVVYPFALAQTALSSLHRVDALSDTDDTPGRNYLVVGSDSRAGTDLEAVQSTRTDTIMLLHVPSSGGPTVMMSIPRDSDVAIPGHGHNKINASYAIGGPQLLVKTVERAIGVHIDDYVETGFAGFGDIINSIGGITVCPKTALKDSLSGLNVPAGCQAVNGTTALAYARMRHGDPLGDLGRVQRQREVITQIAKKTMSPTTLLNPFSAFPLAKSGGNALTVDRQLGILDLAYFAYGMKEVSGGSGLSLTVPVSDPGKRTSYGDVVEWDAAKSKIVFNALKDDSTEAIRPFAEQQAASANNSAVGG